MKNRPQPRPSNDARKREVNPAFYEALADAGKRTTPEELKAKGVKKLRTYRLSEISFLIEKALNRTLVERTLGSIQPEEMADLANAAESEFRTQVESLEELRESRGKLREQRDSMQVELARLRDRVAQREARSKELDSDDLRHMLLEMRGALRPLLDTARAPDWLVKDVLSDLMQLVKKQRDEALGDERDDLKREISQLERRVTKLVASLEETERVLARVAATKDLETGIASIYRTVQGLSSGEENLDQKRRMMAAVFAANLELQRALELRAHA